MDVLRERLAAARLYLVCDIRDDAFLHAVLGAGVDVVQLRAKHADEAELVAAGRRFADAAHAHDALFIVNDRPELVAPTGADGVHVGQDDATISAARGVVGAHRLVGLSTHTPAEIAAATPTTGGALGADYIGVGPVHATPTKPGRPAVGTALVADAAVRATVPFFAIGGIDATNAASVCAAGARRIAVVRAITEARDPAAAARDLRAILDRAVTTEAMSVGAA